MKLDVVSSQGSAVLTICDRIHFRPLIRPHTDPTLGHCSYLNTCYSEPTYAQSPSIPPLPSHRAIGYGQQGGQGVSLPSGLGAGGRGKEKAPCRYLHFEVDWDGGDGPGQNDQRQVAKRKPFRLEMGTGPNGLDSPTVSIPHRDLLISISPIGLFLAVSATMDKL